MNRIYHFLIALMLMISGQNVFGQSTVFQTLITNYAALNATQKANYDKMITQGVYKPDIKFISYNSEAVSDTNGLLKLGLGLYLGFAVKLNQKTFLHIFYFIKYNLLI